MTEKARRILVAVLALLAASCGGGPERQPDDGKPSETAPGANRTAEPVNLLEDKTQNQLLFDLDRLSDEWQRARSDRRPMAYASIERHIRRKVEENIDMLVDLAGDDSNERGRRIVARALGFSERREARQALVGLIATDDPALLESALMGLALSATEDLPVKMIAGQLGHYDARVQRNAALALYRAILAGATLEGAVLQGTITRLRVLLMDRDHAMLRGNAAAALSVLSSSESENDLLNLLGDSELYPRLKAIIALGRVGTKLALMPLVQMLRSPEKNMRTMAARALSAITDRLEYDLDRSVLGEDPGAWSDAIKARLAKE